MEHKKDIERRMEKRLAYYVKQAFKIFAMVVIFVILFSLAVYVLMRLWNWLLPDLFGAPMINYWQALGIMVLAKLIFGFGGSGGGKSKSKQKSDFKSSRKCGSLRSDFDEWKHYDNFWKEEGESAYKAYLEKIKNENHDT